MGESFEDCARRECREEAGIEIDNVRFLYLHNLKKYLPKHYVHIELIADWKSGEPQNMEPDKSDGWQWYTIDDLPRPIFYTESLALEAMRTGNSYYDA